MSFISTARRALRTVGTMTAALALVSCTSDILNVGTPDVLSADVLGGSLGATTLRNGALQDFVVSFSGTQDGFLMSSGNMSDEIQTSDTFADRYFTDGRKQNELLGGATNGLYNGMHLARTGLTSAIVAWGKSKSATNTAVRDSLSELYSLRGFNEDFFAEAYCNGVPFSSTAEDGSPVYGDPLTTAQILARAGATFDSATTIATGTSYKSLAAIGKARVLLNLGQFAQAAAAVSGVATNYKYFVYHSVATGRQQNGVFNGASVASSRYTAGTREGVNGLDFLSTPADPRAPWSPSNRTGFNSDPNLPLQTKYPALNSNVVLADGIEARLIEAEARLQGATQADRDAVFASLNVLRATGLATAIAPLPTSPATQDAAVDMLFKERAFWMWLTGHRMGDMRRLIRQYRRDQAIVFPVGAMPLRRGESFGTDVNFVVPFNERNNPKFAGCIDRNP